ncbi:MAG: hypothetical protein Q9218_004269 [Villophora microphyllina]
MEQILHKSKHWDPTMSFTTLKGFNKWLDEGSDGGIAPHEMIDVVGTWLFSTFQTPIDVIGQRVNGWMGPGMHGLNWQLLAAIIKMEVETGDSPLKMISEMMAKINPDITRLSNVDCNVENIRDHTDAMNVKLTIGLIAIYEQLLAKGLQLWDARFADHFRKIDAPIELFHDFGTWATAMSLNAVILVAFLTWVEKSGKMMQEENKKRGKDSKTEAVDEQQGLEE